MPKIKVKGQTVQTGERPQTNGHTRTHTDATKRIISPATRSIITPNLNLTLTLILLTLNEPRSTTLNHSLSLYSQINNHAVRTADKVTAYDDDQLYGRCSERDEGLTRGATSEKQHADACFMACRPDIVVVVVVEHNSTSRVLATGVDIATRLPQDPNRVCVWHIEHR